MSDQASGVVDPGAAAGYERAIARRGRSVTIQRVNGVAPRTAMVSATVTALVQDDSDDVRETSRTGYGSSEPGSISQGQRMIIVLARDLVAQRFPLPLQKNDKVILSGSTEKLNVNDVDDEKRRFGGAIEIKASGVS